MDQSYHYQLTIKKPGKYVIIFELINNASSLSQTSFNMYFNQVYEQTFTYHQFKGILKANAYKLLDVGDVLFSLKFNHSGLTVKSLKIHRHP